MTQSTTQKLALQHIAKQFADFLAGAHGNPQALDESDIELLNALKDGAADHLDVMTAQEIFRKQEWCGHIPEAVQDVDATTSQIAADVARLEDMQKQNPALLRSSLDSLRDSMLKLDSLLEQHVGHFASAERLSRGTTTRERQ